MHINNEMDENGLAECFEIDFGKSCLFKEIREGMEADRLIRESETGGETCLSSSLCTSDGFQRQNNQTVIVDRDKGCVWNLNACF